MKDVFFSIDASIVLNGKNIRGTLGIDTQRIKFVSNDSVLLEKSIIWDNLEYTVKKEKVRKFLLFSSSNYLISFTENGISLPCFVIDEKHGEAITKTIDIIKKVLIEQKKCQQKLEEERRSETERLKAERRRKLEEERRKEAEGLEAERRRKLEEERRKEVERLEAEHQRKLEEELRRKNEGELKREAERLVYARTKFTQTLAASLKKTEWELVVILNRFVSKRKSEEFLRGEDYQRRCNEKQRKEAERLEAEYQRKLEEELRRKNEGKLKREAERLVYARTKFTQTLAASLKKTEWGLVVILNQYANKRKSEEFLKEDYQRRCNEEQRKEVERLEAEHQRKLEVERKREAECLADAREKFTQTLAASLKKTEWELVVILNQYANKRKSEEFLKEDYQRRCNKEQRREAERLEKDQRKEIERFNLKRWKKLKEKYQKEAELLKTGRLKNLEEEHRKEAEQLEAERRRKLEEERRKEAEQLEAERRRKLDEERQKESERIKKEHQRKLEKERSYVSHQIVVNQAEQHNEHISHSNFDIDEYYDYDYFLHYQDTNMGYNPWVESFSRFIERYCEYCYDGRGILIARKAQILLLSFSASKNRVIDKEILEYEYEDFVSEYYSVRANSEVEYLVENIIMNALYANEYNERLLAETLEIILTDFHNSYMYRSISDEAENDISKQYYSTYSYKWEVIESTHTISSLYSDLYNYASEEDLVNDIKSVAFEKAAEIIAFVRNQNKPVSIGQLRKNFPLIRKRTVLKLFEESSEIINYRKRYFSSLQINLSYAEKEMIKEEIENYLESESISHIEGIYDFLRLDYNRVLSKMFVNNSYELFSVLSVLYRENFEFKRPFITILGYSIPTTQEWLQAYILNYDELPLENVLSYAREKYLKIPNITDFIVSISGTTILKNKYTFIQRRLVVENESVIQTVDSLIYNELQSTVPVKAIRDLSCIVNMPQISIPWNEWLIFSVLLIGVRKTHLFTTSNTYKSAIPVVSLKTKINTKELQQIADRYAGYEDQDTDVLIDNLDDLDSLIEEDISFDDIEDIDFDFDDYDEDEE